MILSTSFSILSHDEKIIFTTLFLAQNQLIFHIFSNSDDPNHTQLLGPVCEGAELPRQQRDQPHHLQLTGY